jgi:Protein of unknown function (DUF1553)
LLDYLAVHFAGDGYDLRKFIRFVMTSRAYQSQTVILAKEPGVDYVYSGPIARRMSAEQFIDTIWQITGTHPPKADAKVNREISADATPPPIRAALVQNDFLMRSLGRPHRDQVVTTRPSGLTTLQAIDLANGDILANYLKMGAQTLTKASPDRDLLKWLYQYAFSRAPNAAEQAILKDVVAGDQPKALLVEDLLWLVFMQPEYQIIR